MAGGEQVMADRADHPKGKPFSVRLTEAEKEDIRRRAGETPLGAYLREAALGHALPARASPQPWRIKDREAIARVLGLLGSSRLASNLNQLAKAANLGSLPVTQETEADLRRACADIAAMRAALMQALGIQAATAGGLTKAAQAFNAKAVSELQS